MGTSMEGVTITHASVCGLVALILAVTELLKRMKMKGVAIPWSDEEATPTHESSETKLANGAPQQLQEFSEHRLCREDARQLIDHLNGAKQVIEQLRIKDPELFVGCSDLDEFGTCVEKREPQSSSFEKGQAV